ncbi:MAG: response regulator transcription factor [Thermodesulfovibrionales bacterium]
MSIRILMADDHRMFREGLRHLLEKEEDFLIVGEAENGRTAVKLAMELSPDIILMDVNMKDLNGIEATRQIASKKPSIRVVGLSMYSERQFVTEMLLAGVKGYLLKDAAIEELVLGIRTVMDGEVYLSPKIATGVIEEFTVGIKRAGSSVFSTLTPREREVLQMIAEGKSTKDIAFSLEISVKTIETFRQQIMAKLDIHSVAGLVKFAIREGLSSLEG